MDNNNRIQTGKTPLRIIVFRVIIVLTLLVLAFDGILFLRLKYFQKQEPDQPLDQSTNMDWVDTSDFREVTEGEVLDLDKVDFFEKRLNDSVDDRARMAKQVLKDRYDNYDNAFLLRSFGVSTYSKSFIVLTGIARKISDNELEVNSGDFTYAVKINDNIIITQVFETQQCNEDKSQCIDDFQHITINEINDGDLIALHFNRSNSEAPRKLWFITLYTEYVEKESE